MISSKMSIEDRSEEGLTDLEFFQNMRETSRRLRLDVASTAADIQSISKELQPKCLLVAFFLGRNGRFFAP